MPDGAGLLLLRALRAGVPAGLDLRGADEQRRPLPGQRAGALSPRTVPDGVSCWYCAGGAPHLAQCVSAALWSECQAQGAARCWSLAGPTATCD